MINKNEGEEEAMKIKSNDQNDFIRGFLLKTKAV